MTAEIERYDGTVAQLLGDGLLAMFGAPVAHEDDSERAVRAGLAIQRALASYARRGARGLRHRPGRARRRQHRPGRGDRPAKATTAAATTRSATPSTWPPGCRRSPTADRGHARPADGSPGAQLLRARGARRDPAARPRARRSTASAWWASASRARQRRDEPLVGRDGELATVSDGLERLADGIGAIVSITGEPGIGKSRLVAEACDAARATGCACSRAAASPTRRASRTGRCASCCATGSASGAAASEARVRLDLKAAAARRSSATTREPYPFLAGLLGLHAGRRDVRAACASSAARRSAAAASRRWRNCCARWLASGRCCSCSRTCTGRTSRRSS